VAYVANVNGGVAVGYVAEEAKAWLAA